MATVLPSLATLVFAVSSMLSVGFSTTLRGIVGPLRNTRAVGLALLANFVLVPLLAFFVVRLLGVSGPQAVGLMLLATAAGAPFLIKLTAAAATDVPLGGTLLVLLLPTTVIYMPLVVPLLLPGTAVSAGAIAWPLILSMLLPLAIGLFIKERAARWAARLQPIMAKTSTYALMVLIGSLLLVNLPGILEVTMRTILAAVLLVSGGFVVGYLLGSPTPAARAVLGLGTAQRNIAAATVVATQGFTDPRVVITVVVTSLVALAVLFPLASKLREHGTLSFASGRLRERAAAARARGWATGRRLRDRAIAARERARASRREPRTGQPTRARQPRTSQPRTGEPRTGEPRTGQPRTGEPRAGGRDDASPGR